MDKGLKEHILNLKDSEFSVLSGIVSEGSEKTLYQMYMNDISPVEVEAFMKVYGIENPDKKAMMLLKYYSGEVRNFLTEKAETRPWMDVDAQLDVYWNLPPFSRKEFPKPETTELKSNYSI